MHINNGHCEKCLEIFSRYPGFNDELMTWFLALQIESPEAHISSAGRGKFDQQLLFQKGASKAEWGKSAHNWNAAIDIFALIKGEASWEPKWFNTVVAPALYPAIVWYGRTGAPYYELPHCELASWNEMAKSGLLKKVE